MQKILIIEDDKVIARTLKEHLCKWDYDADFVVDFKNITEQVVSFAPQLILLDISLPYFNGFYWCGEIRKFSNVPIIFISSASDKMNSVMENSGKVVPRDMIDDNTLTVNMTRLRKKLEDAGLCDFIVTKKGLGYIVR